ncbi:hypothetical protein ACIQPP_50005 [Streptomyces violaceusniger]|uniref:hypothetical protein n=1 Tax=Streptomyces violaceusniger TaxID=68280 RepID=UPI0009C3DF4E|nr:hypothetical protein [Streptomyces hygroscopicus]AQW48554.1 hypothetical protein SHXM_02017 [Streptomyces hygroscopicus]
MKKMIRAAAATAFLLGGAAWPAHADATVKKGKVGLVVKGKKLSVKQAGGWMDGHGTGVKARLYSVYKGVRTDITRWKDATPTSAGMTKFSNVNWKFDGRKFTNGTWLCIQFNKTDVAPCAKIHR